MFFVLEVLAHIRSPVFPGVRAVPLHHAPDEGALVDAAVRPRELPQAVHLVGVPETGILAAVRPIVYAFSTFLPIFIFSIIIAAVTPKFDSSSVLRVFS